MNKIFIIPILALIFSCDQLPPIPDEVFPKEKMSAVLLDMHLAEATAQHQVIARDSVLKILPGYYAQVFDKHSITKAEFDKSLNFYMKYPEHLDVVYQDIVNELNKKEAELVPGKSKK